MNPNPFPDTPCASYNIVNDRLKVWFDRRLTNEEYAEIRKAGFAYWRGSKCFTRVWSPDAEDFIAVRHGIVIEEDDDPDDTEARVERFSRYAERAESSAVGAQDRLISGRANTERRQRLASGVFNRDVDKAEYWQRRIEASIRHANFKENPGLIARRIDGLETDLRYWEAQALPPSSNPRDRSVDQHTGAVSFWVKGPGNRSGFWVREGRFPAMQANAKRWVDHIEARLLYERAVLAATGSVQAQLAEPDGVKIEVGGAIKCSRDFDDRWLFVIKVNPKTVAIYDGYFASTPYMAWRYVDKTRVSAIATKLRVDSSEVAVIRPPVVEKKPDTTDKTRDGRIPEKAGAVGLDESFGREPARIRWYPIIRVDRRTVEIGYKEVLAGVPKLYKRKEQIRSLRLLKSAAEVAAELPEVLALFNDITAVKKASAARKRAAKAQAAAA